MTTLELLNIEGVIIFDYNHDYKGNHKHKGGFKHTKYAYISKQMKKDNNELRAFHNIINIIDNELIIIHSSTVRTAALKHFESLGYKKN